MTGKQEGPYKGEETKVEEDKVWHTKRLKYWTKFIDLVKSKSKRFSKSIKENKILQMKTQIFGQISRKESN